METSLGALKDKGRCCICRKKTHWEKNGSSSQKEVLLTPAEGMDGEEVKDISAILDTGGN